MTTTLQRTTFTTNRALEFFTEKELTMQMGHEKEVWPAALLKELVDNALDACEGAGIAPHISVEITDDTLTVADNGPGLPTTTLERSLDYMVRVSSNNFYVSPTRGQLGNALKTVWAAPFVALQRSAVVEVESHGTRHVITVSVDSIAGEPKIDFEVTKVDDVKNGTKIIMHWPGIASYLNAKLSSGFYIAILPGTLLARYAAFNPHAHFELDNCGNKASWQATDITFSKWLPSSQTSPHWYDQERITLLIAAYINADRESGRDRSVREFVEEFRGLTGTAKQKQVTDTCGLTGAKLSDLITSNGLDSNRVLDLLCAMCALSRPVAPAQLGIIGEKVMTAWLNLHGGDDVEYRRAVGDINGLPYVLEVAKATLPADAPRCLLMTGLNWTPALLLPFNANNLLDDNRVDYYDQIAIVIHLACPQLNFTDRGKSSSSTRIN